MTERVLTPNQIVAHNLAQIRRGRGLTQAQFAEALEPLLGVRWSPAVLSAAERSVDGKRVREFSADELVAIARVLGVAVTKLIGPQSEDIRMATPDQPQGLSIEEVMTLTDGTGVLNEAASRKLREDMSQVIEKLDALEARRAIREES